MTAAHELNEKSLPNLGGLFYAPMSGATGNTRRSGRVRRQRNDHLWTNPRQN
jgi:hypothetical protein